MPLKLFGAKHLSDDAKLWKCEERFDTMEIHEHRFLRLGVGVSQNVARNPVLVNDRF